MFMCIVFIQQVMHYAVVSMQKAPVNSLSLDRVIETWLLLAVLKVPIGGDGSNIQYFQGFVGGAAI